MKLAKRRLAADVAAAQQRLCREQLDNQWQPLAQRIEAQRSAWLLGSSFVGGALIARWPGKLLFGSLNTVLGLASFVLRTPVGRLVIASMATARSKTD